MTRLRTIALVIGAAMAVGAATATALGESEGVPDRGPATPPVRILAVGDFGTADASEERTGAAMRRYEAANPATAFVALGDNDYTESAPTFEAAWEKSFGWLEPSGVRVLGILGNHDVAVDEGRYQFDALDMPARFYSRRFGPVEIFALDTTAIDDGPDTAQLRWLRGALARSRAPWKIVALHWPLYNCGEHPQNLPALRSWAPLFERYGVQLVVSGDDHNYQRFAVRGVAYVVSGGGGAELYPLETCPGRHPRLLARRVVHHFLSVTVRGSSLEGVAVALNGFIVDRFQVHQRPTAGDEAGA